MIINNIGIFDLESVWHLELHYEELSIDTESMNGIVSALVFLYSIPEQRHTANT